MQVYFFNLKTLNKMNTINLKTIKPITISSLFFFSILLIFSSCKKEHHHDSPSPEAVAINIQSPIDMHAYDMHDTVFINATISSPTELHGYEIHLTRLADSTLVLNKHIHEHVKNFKISEYWVNDGKIHSDMKLEVVANLDDNANTVIKTMKFHCHSH